MLFRPFKWSTFSLIAGISTTPIGHLQCLCQDVVQGIFPGGEDRGWEWLADYHVIKCQETGGKLASSISIPLDDPVISVPPVENSHHEIRISSWLKSRSSNGALRARRKKQMEEAKFILLTGPYRLRWSFSAVTLVTANRAVDAFPNGLVESLLFVEMFADNIRKRHTDWFSQSDQTIWLELTVNFQLQLNNIFRFVWMEGGMEKSIHPFLQKLHSCARHINVLSTNKLPFWRKPYSACRLWLENHLFWNCHAINTLPCSILVTWDSLLLDCRVGPGCLTRKSLWNVYNLSSKIKECRNIQWTSLFRYHAYSLRFSLRTNWKSMNRRNAIWPIKDCIEWQNDRTINSLLYLPWELVSLSAIAPHLWIGRCVWALFRAVRYQ